MVNCRNNKFNQKIDIKSVFMANYVARNNILETSIKSQS